MEISGQFIKQWEILMRNRKTKFQELNTVSESESSLLPNLNNSHKFLRILWRKLMWNFG